MLLEKKCIGFKICQTLLQLNDEPVSCPSQSMPIIPKLDGPFLCTSCREDAVIARMARVKMELKFGWVTAAQRAEFNPDEV